jgi:copper chaperone CopZ
MNTPITLKLSGLHCKACVGRVTHALTPLAENVTVTLDPQQAVISNARAPLAALIAAVSTAGAYTAMAEPVDAPNPTPHLAAPASTTYWPLALLTGYLVAVPALAQWNTGAFDAQAWMRHFMAAFFLAFSFFKLLDVRAFASAYAGYDLLAARWPTWGLLYPFVELALGIAYLTNVQPLLTNALTFIVMTFSLLGVLRAVLSKKTIQCACLGTVFNLPMSTVTIIEDGLMALMALWMLVRHV